MFRRTIISILMFNRTIITDLVQGIIIGGVLALQTGPFMAEKDKGVLVKGATGFGTRTLIRLAINLSK